MPRKAAYILTPVGPKEGRYDVTRIESMTQMQGTIAVNVPKAKIVKEVSPRSKEAIRSIVRNHATGLRKLADR